MTQSSGARGPTRRELLRGGLAAAVGALVPRGLGAAIPGVEATVARFATEGATTAAPAPRPGAPLFDPEALHETRLDLAPADWKRLCADYLSNRYYPAELRVDGAKAGRVAIRSRGDGSRSGRKPGLRVDLNRERPGQQFQGLKSLVLDNMLQDETCLRERLAFLVFEAMGVPAPRYSHTRLSVNGEDFGLYALIEPVDKTFLRSRGVDAGGNLFYYKYEVETDTFYDFSYRGDDAARYLPRPFEPRTHEKKPDASGLLALIRTLQRAADASLRAELSSHLDLDAFASYLAVENAVADSDGFAADSGRNNFYLYQPPGGRFTPIPWDKDMAFQRADWPVFLNLERNLLTRRLLADRAWREGYVAKVRTALARFVNARWLGPRLEAAYQQIRGAVHADRRKEFASEAFEYGVAALRTLVAGRERGMLPGAAW